MTGWLSTTRIEGTPKQLINIQGSELHYFQRPDFNHEDVDSNATHLSGYAGRFAINKQKGNVAFNTA
jgi:hypothetical protein